MCQNVENLVTNHHRHLHAATRTIYIDLRCSAAKDTSSTHAATPLRHLDAHLDAAIKMRCEHQVADPNLYIRMATQHGNSHAATPLQFASLVSKFPYNSAHTHTQYFIQSSLKPPLQCGQEYIETTAAAPPTHIDTHTHTR